MHIYTQIASVKHFISWGEKFEQKCKCRQISFESISVEKQELAQWDQKRVPPEPGVVITDLEWR